MDFVTTEFHQDTWNRYLMWGFVLPHIPWNTISNLEVQRSYNAWRCELVLPSASSFSNICRREYSLTVDAIKKKLPTGNKVSLALDGWTSTNKLAITSIIAYYMDRNWAMREVQLSFDEVNSLFFFQFNSSFKIIGQGSTYWSKASHTSKRSSRSFWAYWRQRAWNDSW